MSPEVCLALFSLALRWLASWPPRCSLLSFHFITTINKHYKEKLAICDLCHFVFVWAWAITDTIHNSNDGLSEKRVHSLLACVNSARRSEVLTDPDFVELNAL